MAQDDLDRSAVAALWAPVAACAFGALGACAATARAPRGIEPRAAAHVQQARHLLRGGAAEWAAAGGEIALARAADPDWIGALRLEQEWLRQMLRGPEAYAQAHARASVAPDRGESQYLVARMEGALGLARLEASREADPGSAWTWHGAAVASAARGDHAAAAERERRALGLARGSFERATCAASLGAALARSGQGGAAEAALESALRAPLDDIDRRWLEAELALRRLEAPDAAARGRGADLALAALGSGDVEPSLAQALFERVASGADGAGGAGGAGGRGAREALAALELGMARGARAAGGMAAPGASSPELEALAARAELELAPSPASWERVLAARAATGRGAPQSAYARQLALESWRGPAAQGLAAAVDRSWSELPERVRAAAAQGTSALPRLVDAARASADSRVAPGVAGADALRAELGAALLAAGWSAELAWLAGEAPLAPPSSSSADTADGRGERLVLAGAERVVGALRALVAERGRGALGETIRAGLADAARELESAGVLADGGEPAGTPELEYGVLARTLHPGPWFSEADERAGLGGAGELVPGLPRLLAAIGRWGIFGRLAGQPIDGCLLRPLSIERAGGTILGAPWSGTIVIGEGLEIRPGGAGEVVSRAELAGAAVHEGYWIDLDALRGAAEGLDALAWRFGVGGAGELAAAALATRGPPMPLRGQAPLAAGERERGRLVPLLGEGDRVRLAVLVERALGSERAAPGAGGVELGELLEVVELHERAHLCDRARFLPLARRWPAALAFALSSGLAPAAIHARLEYRAELATLASASEPRLPLADVLDLAEAEELEPGSGGAHMRAYRRLAAELLQELARMAENDPASFAGSDVDGYLAWDLHRLSPDVLRRAALALAEREGLVR